MPTKITSQNRSSENAIQARENLYRLFRERPIKDEELLDMAAFYESNAINWIGTGFDQSTQHSPGCLPETLAN